MPYDSSLPADHAPIVAAELRNQFNGLNDAITSSPGFGDLDNAVTTQTPKNVDAVGVPGISFSNPPTQAEVQALQDKLSELIMALHRT
jgi:hypothetical protein